MACFRQTKLLLYKTLNPLVKGTQLQIKNRVF